MPGDRVIQVVHSRSESGQNRRTGATKNRFAKLTFHAAQGGLRRSAAKRLRRLAECAEGSFDSRARESRWLSAPEVAQALTKLQPFDIGRLIGRDAWAG